jgi:hypothetical protein
LQFARYIATAELLGPAEKSIKLCKGFGYLKPALKWIKKWEERDTFLHAQIYDVNRGNPAWDSLNGYLDDYRISGDPA